MIEARALVSINFLNLSENYDFMSRWLPHVLQRFEPLDDPFAGRILLLLAEERDRVVHGHLQHVVDRLVPARPAGGRAVTSLSL